MSRVTSNSMISYSTSRPPDKRDATERNVVPTPPNRSSTDRPRRTGSPGLGETTSPVADQRRLGRALLPLHVAVGRLRFERTHDRSSRLLGTTLEAAPFGLKISVPRKSLHHLPRIEPTSRGVVIGSACRWETRQPSASEGNPRGSAKCVTRSGARISGKSSRHRSEPPHARSCENRGVGRTSGGRR
jgi:hypothetical protein